MKQSRLLTLAAAAAASVLSLEASALVLTYDDIGVPNSVFPYYTQTGFVELGYQFGNNMDVVDLSPGSSWPYGAHSGNYSALNDYGGTGVITKVGGGTFAFDSTYIKGWANTGIAAGTIAGYLNGNLVSSVQFSTTGSNWQHVIANFLSVDEVRIVGDTFLLDDTQINGPSSVPVPAALPLFASGLGLLGLAGWRKRRRSRA